MANGASPHLLAMPLHAITEVYGETGLRGRFELETRRLPDADRAALTDALDWATKLHSGQKRVREPYVNHLLRVMRRQAAHRPPARSRGDPLHRDPRGLTLR